MQTILNRVWNVMINDDQLWKNQINNFIENTDEWTSLFPEQPKFDLCNIGREFELLHDTKKQTWKQIYGQVIKFKPTYEYSTYSVASHVRKDVIAANNCAAKLRIGRISLSKKKEIRFVMIGLDAAGKTTICYNIQLSGQTTIPTIGFNVETFTENGLNIVTWDVGGPDKIRPLWRHYFQASCLLIFVIDSNDRERAGEAEEELSKMLREDELRDVPLLVYANKQDLPNAMKVSEISDKLRLNQLKSRKWNIVPCCAITGAGIYEGIDWVASVLGL